MRKGGRIHEEAAEPTEPVRRLVGAFVLGTAIKSLSPLGCVRVLIQKNPRGKKYPGGEVYLYTGKIFRESRPRFGPLGSARGTPTPGSSQVFIGCRAGLRLLGCWPAALAVLR